LGTKYDEEITEE